MSYSILASVDGAPFTEAANLPPDRTFLTINDFTTGAQYCFTVRANLAGGKTSGSNKYCLLTKMKRPPKWINADFATIMPDSSIGISFTIDPASEIRSLHVEKRTGESLIYNWITQIASLNGPLTYNDNEADLSKINYYRAYTLNNCSIAVAYSNIASTIVLSVERNEDQVLLKWNHYRKWLGDITGYNIFVNTGSGFYEKAFAGAEDSTFTINYKDLMYEITGKEVCFRIKASEVSNPYGINGESISSTACVPVTELITVPNTFTPDNNGVNDLFRPVLSFTPRSYQLIITDLQRRTIFESLDYNEKWDGTGNGGKLPEGVYLWFLRVSTQSGNTMTRTGTVTIIFNR
jgi:gliding motility-associated-like protein